MNTRQAFRIFMKHQLEFAIEEGIISDLEENDIEHVITEWEHDPDFHLQMADFLNEMIDMRE